MLIPLRKLLQLQPKKQLKTSSPSDNQSNEGILHFNFQLHLIKLNCLNSKIKVNYELCDHSPESSDSRLTILHFGGKDFPILIFVVKRALFFTAPLAPLLSPAQPVAPLAPPPPPPGASSPEEERLRLLPDLPLKNPRLLLARLTSEDSGLSLAALGKSGLSPPPLVDVSSFTKNDFILVFAKN